MRRECRTNDGFLISRGELWEADTAPPVQDWAEPMPRMEQRRFAWESMVRAPRAASWPQVRSSRACNGNSDNLEDIRARQCHWDNRRDWVLLRLEPRKRPRLQRAECPSFAGR